jgi:hypothetical protein
MDFGALVSTTFDKVDKDVYPLIECLWFQTQGKNEIQEKKTKKNSLKNSYHCLVFLHKDHKHYWSSHKKHYEPFLIAPTDTDNRKSIQDYFTATYGLEVSVRPSFGNGKLIPGLGSFNPGIEGTVKLFHAQIQTGTISLPEYSKQIKEDWMTKNIEIL